MVKEFWLYAALITTAVVVNATITLKVDPAGGNDLVFFEDFDSPDLDSSRWLIAKKQWGGLGNNGGVVPENVAVADGNLILEAHGDRYTGPVKGINRYGVPRVHGRRVGAAIATKDYFGSGRYEVRAKLAPVLGACSSFYTLHYREVRPGEKGYEMGGAVVNHEINIEFPGRPSEGAIDEVAFDHGLFNTWRALTPGDFNHAYIYLGRPMDDGQYHTYRFDWHTGGGTSGGQPRVEFYIDDQLVHISYDEIPVYAGRFWVGLWFPDKWAGKPDFDTAKMYVDWVRITPLNEPGDKRGVSETYANEGWASPEEYPSYALAIATNTNPSSLTPLIVADFDDTSATTSLGGRYNTFRRAPSRASVGITQEQPYGQSGRSLEITYDRKSRGWCGLWMRLVPEGQVFDAAGYRYLTFYVRGDKGGEDFDITLSWDRTWSQNDDSKMVGNIQDFLPSGVTQQWQKVKVPLAQSLRFDMNVMSGFAVVCRGGSGKIFIDQVQLED